MPPTHSLPVAYLPHSAWDLPRRWFKQAVSRTDLRVPFLNARCFAPDYTHSLCHYRTPYTAHTFIPHTAPYCLHATPTYTLQFDTHLPPGTFYPRPALYHGPCPTPGHLPGHTHSLTHHSCFTHWDTLPPPVCYTCTCPPHHTCTGPLPTPLPPGYPHPDTAPVPGSTGTVSPVHIPDRTLPRTWDGATPPHHTATPIAH